MRTYNPAYLVCTCRRTTLNTHVVIVPVSHQERAVCSSKAPSARPPLCGAFVVVVVAVVVGGGGCVDVVVAVVVVVVTFVDRRAWLERGGVGKRETRGGWFPALRVLKLNIWTVC